MLYLDLDLTKSAVKNAFPVRHRNHSSCHSQCNFKHYRSRRFCLPRRCELPTFCCRSRWILITESQRTFSLDTTPLTQFVSYAILNTPLNCAWQEWLESKFPGSTTSDPAVAHPAGANGYKEKRQNDINSTQQTIKTTADAQTRSLNVRNTMTKFALDQTIGAVFNTVLFIVGISAIKGLSWDEIVSAVKNVSPLAGLHIC